MCCVPQVNRLNAEVEEERSARRLLEKVLTKMCEEQTLKVVERECGKERKARDASMKQMKEYADLIHEKVTTREREAAGERCANPDLLCEQHPPSHEWLCACGMAGVCSGR